MFDTSRCGFAPVPPRNQESEEDKKDRLLRELSEDTKTQKKKPWYGLF